MVFFKVNKNEIEIPKKKKAGKSRLKIAVRGSETIIETNLNNVIFFARLTLNNFFLLFYFVLFLLQR